jgi:4-hydroxy-tetrahydrodipicolinate synthase
VISVASNLYAREIGRMVQFARANDFARAGKIHRRLYPAFKTHFIEPNPVPIKAALVRAGIIQSSEVRSPLCDMAPASAKALEQVLARLD